MMKNQQKIENDTIYCSYILLEIYLQLIVFEKQYFLSFFYIFFYIFFVINELYSLISQRLQSALLFHTDLKVGFLIYNYISFFLFFKLFYIIFFLLLFFIIFFSLSLNLGSSKLNSLYFKSSQLDL